MSYPYGNQPSGIGYTNPGPSYRAPSGSQLGFEGVPPYPPSGQSGFGNYGYPPQGGVCPPSSGYPQQYGGGQPTPGGYPPQPSNYGQSGQPPLSYPQAGSYQQPAPGGQYPAYGGPTPGGQYPAPSGYPAPGGGQSGAPYGAPAQQPYGGPPATQTLGYGHGGSNNYQTPTQPAQGYGYGSPGGYGGQQVPSGGTCSGGGAYGGQSSYGGGNPSGPTMSYGGSYFQGTVKPSPSFNPSADCEALKKAMKGIGCDDKAVINVLCYRTNAQRQQIRQTFKTMYGKDLIKELVSELRGNLEDVVVALMHTQGEFDAMELQHAMAGAGTTESTLIEIMATRTNAEVRDIKMAYRAIYGKDLESALVNETSGYFKRMLVSLCNAGRDESMSVDAARARKSAEDLLRAGVKRWGTDEATFNAVLCAQSYPQLQAVFEEYRKLAGHDIEQAIKQEFSGDIEDGLMAIVKSAKNAPAFFAECAYKAMAGMGTNDRRLIRVIVSRCEKDMVQIKQEFQRIYGKSLDGFIAGDTSGKYKDALVALVRGN